MGIHIWLFYVVFMWYLVHSAVGSRVGSPGAGVKNNTGLINKTDTGWKRELFLHLVKNAKRIQMESKSTRPDTRLPQSRADGQGPYLRSLDHLGRGSEAQHRKKSSVTDGRTDGRTDKAGCRVAKHATKNWENTRNFNAEIRLAMMNTFWWWDPFSFPTLGSTNVPMLWRPLSPSFLHLLALRRYREW